MRNVAIKCEKEVFLDEIILFMFWIHLNFSRRAMQVYIGLQTALYMCICVHTGVNFDHIEKFRHIILNFSILLILPRLRL